MTENIVIYHDLLTDIDKSRKKYQLLASIEDF